MSLRHWLGFLGPRKLRDRVGFMDTGQDREDDGRGKIGGETRGGRVQRQRVQKERKALKRGIDEDGKKCSLAAFQY